MKKLIFLVLSSIFVLIIPNLKVSALQYTSDVKYHHQILIGTQNGVLELPAFDSGGVVNKPEIILQINKTISCNTSQCVISLPFALTAEMIAYNDSSTRQILGGYQIVSMFGLTYGTSANTSCVVADGTIDCVVPNGNNLPLIELFPTRIGLQGTSWSDFEVNLWYTYGGFVTIYDLVGQASDVIGSINNTTNAVNDVNNSINNDSVSSNTENSSTAQSWASNNASDSVVSDMVLMPITLLTAFSNGFNGTCQSYNLGSLYGTNLNLPCINISNYLGATLWGIIDVLMSGFLIYGIGKKFVRVFNDFTNLKDSQVDELYGGGNQ